MSLSSNIGTFTYSSFAYTQVTSDRYATPLPTPLVISTPYAPHFDHVSTLLPENITYTTYSLNPSATDTQDGPYGQSAYAALWDNYTFTTSPPFTTTVSPTPVPSSELVFPPALYNRPYVDQNTTRLPDDFIWGVAGSAWQTEGGLQHQGRGPALLDIVGTEAYPYGNDSNVANMHYFLYKQDIARLAAVGIPYYSFSISWTRVVPFGTAGSPVNTQALEHYDDVINTCLEYGITPIVTLMHVDTPLGMPLGDESCRQGFLYYAKVVMTRYADRVPIWITLNEPNFTFFYGYSAMTNILLQHADVYHWYKDVLGGTGRLSMKLANVLAVPRDLSSPADVEAALRYQDFVLGILSNPIYLGRQYPDSVLNTPGVNLTALTDEQIAYIHGTADFYALDPYTAQFASAPPTVATGGGIAGCAANTSDPLWPECASLTFIQNNGWAMGPHGDDDHTYVAPQYVRQQLGYVWNTFHPKGTGGLLITEFGFPVYGEAARAEAEDQRQDWDRSLYFQDFLSEVLKSIHEDGVRVIGALAWTFADDNEWGTYTDQYGMQMVNRTDGRFTRRYKRSIFDFVDFFHAHVSEA